MSSNNKIGDILNLSFSNLAWDKIIDINISFCSPVEEVSKFLLSILLKISIIDLLGPETDNS